MGDNGQVIQAEGDEEGDNLTFAPISEMYGNLFFNNHIVSVNA